MATKTRLSDRPFDKVPERSNGPRESPTRPVPLAASTDAFSSSNRSILLEDDDVYDVFDFITLKWQRSVTVRLWSILFGATALLDFSAATIKRHVSNEIEPTSDRLRDVVVLWFHEHANHFSLLFSLLWFLDSFWEAHRRRVQAVRERDRKLLLENDPGDVDDGEEDWWKGAQGVYFRTIVVQLLLLPVGFYVLCYNRLRELKDPEIGDDDIVEVVHVAVGDTPEETEIFSSQTSVSLGFAVAKHLLLTFGSVTGYHIRLHALAQAKRFAFRQARRAIRNPFRFTRKVRRWLRVVRWIQYLAPLIGSFNKLLGNVKDLLKKQKQHRDAKRAKEIRKKLWDDFSYKERREYCAILIQKTFRAHQARKRLFVMQLLQGQEEALAAIKLQSAFRASLARARVRVLEKWQKLQEIKEQGANLAVVPKKEMSAEERRRMYLVQEELEEEAQHLLNEKLLLRPNTKFAVIWKLLFVLAVIFEIGILVFKPRLARHKDPLTGKPLDIESILIKKLVPTPVARLPICMDEKPFKLTFRKPIKSAMKVLGILKKEEVLSPKPKPFYCGDVYQMLQVSVLFLFLK